MTTMPKKPRGGTLLAYDFENLRQATVASDVGEIRLGNDGHTLVYRANDRLRAIDATADLSDDEPEKPSTESGRKSGWIDLDRANVEIEPRDEWAQMYREAWRLQTEQFWVEDMSDIDWDRVYDRYKSISTARAHAHRTLRCHLGDAGRAWHLARVRIRW